MPTPKKTTERIHQIKITLLGTKPPIWRRVQVPADIKLADLHIVIQIVMGWYGEHLYEFTINQENYGDLDMLGGETEDDSQFSLGELIKKEKARFRYEYDFGDDWEHELVVEKILPAEPGVHYPRCLTGKRACPPEDCGGVWSYAGLLEAIADPKHPGHEEMLEWVEEGFDPEVFDLEDANARLREYFLE